MESEVLAVIDVRQSFEKNAMSRHWIKHPIGPKSISQSWIPKSNTPSGLKVLVVDGEMKSAEGLAKVLHRWGHDCEIAICGLDALRIAARYQPHVAILALEMPWMLGTTIAKHLRADFRKDDCLIIGFTSAVEYQQQQKTGETCIDLLLARPINFGVLKALLLFKSSHQS
jgi:DNA-binding response OmpR family regulator